MSQDRGFPQYADPHNPTAEEMRARIDWLIEHPHSLDPSVAVECPFYDPADDAILDQIWDRVREPKQDTDH